MPDNGAVIITGKLDDTELTKSIDKLVDTVDKKLGKAAETFENNIGRMNTALHNFTQGAKNEVNEIRTTFSAMGTAFDTLRKAIEKAANAWAASNGTGAGSWSGGTKPPSAPGTIGELKEQIAKQKELLEAEKQHTAELQKRVNLLRQMEDSLRRQTTSTEKMRQQAVGMNLRNINSIVPTNTTEAENKLNRLKRLFENLQTSVRNLGVNKFDFLPESMWNRIQASIKKTERELERLKNTATMPATLNMENVMGMSEKTLNEISTKMKAISQLRQQMPINDKNGITQLNMEYSRLSKMQSEILGKNANLISSNSALGRSFNYIKNRLAFTLTVGAFTGFLRSLLEVRGQYELLERSLGVLMDDMERGSQIFNELNEMALKSPFTLIELGTAAKQLSAYNFAADEVVDTTRRLADISSALGVPMERLVYNLGQIKAQGVLNARDARDFANAGLAIVPMLAEMYTEQKRFGEQAVTTAQVYDMMKKKMVTYNDVLRVIQKTTDEGGKFFDFQAKQAGTLKVQLANLNLAWNNMLNDIGKENQGMLSGGVGVIRDMLKNWKQVIQAIKAAGVALGVYKAISMLVGATHAATWGARALINIKNYIAAIKSASGAMATFNAIMSSNVVLALASALAGLITYFTIFNDKVEEASQEVKTFGENGANAINKVKTLEKILKGSEQTSSTYKKALGELNGILDEYGVKQIKESDGIDVVNQKRRELIELIKEESAERERANQLMSGEQRYEEAVEAARKTMEERLRKAQSEPVISGLPFTKNLKEVQENAAAISEIIASVVQNRVQLIAGKTGEEWEKGFNEILKEIQDRMRHIGISEATIKSQWLTDGILRQSNIVSDYINVVSDAKHAQDLHNETVEKNYEYSKNASEATMTFTQKVEANARALRNNSKDAVSLYNRIMDIVKVAEQNHIINFDLRLTAQNPPQWMFDKSLPELEKLARNFAAIAKSAEGMGKINVNGTMFTREEAYERALQYASAAKEKQYKEEQKAQDELNKKKDKNTRANNSNKKSSDELAKALQNEISLIKKLQSEYDKLTKAGVTQQEALALVQDAYGNTLSHINATMRKYKLPELDLSIIKGRDPNSVLKFFTTLRDILSSKGLSNIERMKAVEGVIEEFTVSAKTYNLDKITKGLNNELGKIKEEYELAVELDANPELGDMFAQAFGIDTTGFPKTVQEAVDMMQDSVDKAIAKVQFGEGINIDNEGLLNTFDILRDDIDEWSKATGIALDSNVIDSIKKMQKEARDLYTKDAKQTISDWQKLLEKYAEYETKRTEIQKQAEKERETARKHGASQEIFDSIDLKEQRNLAKLEFDEFQKSATWITATGDLSNLTNKALQMLIDRLWEYKRAAKNLDPKDIIKLNNAMRKLRKEQKKDNPFAAFSISMDEAKQRMEQFEPEIQDLESKIKDLWAKDIDQGGLSDEDQKRLEKYVKLYKELVDLQQEAGKVPFVDKMKSIGKIVSSFKDAASAFKQIADSTNDFQLQQAAEAVDDIIGNFEAAEKGAETWGGWWGAIIGGVTDAIPKIFKWLSGNASIDNKIRKSQLEVKRLELAYKNLQHAVEQAYGVEQYGLQRQIIAYKKLQLEQLKEQLRLEQSRKSKYRNEEAIISLKGEIIDMENEINDATQNIVNDLLGISSVGDFAENLVSSMIKAFKQGEDYMKVFEESFDDMVDNMIVKAIVSRLIGDFINQIFDRINKNVKNSENAQKAQSEIDKIAKERSDVEDAIQKREQEYADLKKWFDKGMYGDTKQALETTLKQLYAKRDELDNQMSGAIDAYNAAIAPTPEDISDIQDMVAQGKQVIKEKIDALMELFGIQFGQNAGDTQLSALQQGISAMSESTAEALLAYWNANTQQQYVQSDLLMQIRDIVALWSGDVQIATQAQILLQLQMSYSIQMSIQETLSNWSSASGLAVRVELAN